jgi:hypothetical protein
MRLFTISEYQRPSAVGKTAGTFGDALKFHGHF